MAAPNRTNEQICPTCGKTFKQLWRHKCNGEAAESSVGNDGAEEMCPTCGKMFKQLSRHKCKAYGATSFLQQDSDQLRDSSSEEMCPTCGKMFKQLSRHKCKGQAATSPTASCAAEQKDSSAEEMCPTCGKMFKQLSRHKCKAQASMSLAENYAAEERDSSIEQMCPTCGKMFKQLSRHKCKAYGATSFLEQDSDELRDSSSEEMCPTCGKMFKQLSRHKCRGRATTSRPANYGDEQDSSAEEMCPTCGKMFKQLSRHKCKGQAATSPTASCAAEQKDSSAEEMCPTCGKMFKQLSRHKCRGRATTSRPANYGDERDSSAEEMCPTCGEMLKQLSQHRCRGHDPKISTSLSTYFDDYSGKTQIKSEKEEMHPVDMESADLCSQAKEQCPVCKQWIERQSQHFCLGSGARPKTKSAQPIADSQSSESTVSNSSQPARVQVSPACKDGLDDCPDCGKTFTRLHRHKCRVAVMPPTPKHIPPNPNNKPTLDTKALEDEAQGVMKALGLQAAADPNTEALGFILDEVKLIQEEKNKAAEAFSGFRERIKKLLKELTECKTWDALNSGSSFDGTKVTRADEIDCMFSPCLASNKRFQINCQNAPPGFCFVELTTPAAFEDPFLKRLLGGQGRLSSQLFRDEVTKVFAKAVEDERRAEKDPDAKEGSPSYAVKLKAIPSPEGGLLPVFIDLVPALKLNELPSGCENSLSFLPAQVAESITKAGFHVVPKQCTDERYKDVSDMLWRMSFSRAEKEMTLHADQKLRQENEQASSPTCRKVVLRMLKRILEICKGMDNSRTGNPKMQQLRKAVDYLREERKRGLKVEKFTTFQVRTLLWAEIYQTCPEPPQWQIKCRRTRLIHSLMQLKKMVSGEMHVTHFFLPHLDIMAEVPRHEREFLYIMFHITKELF